jgi:osmotically-inducible protein OsmY
MSTDADIRADVMAELAWDPVVNPNKVGVSVTDGIVTLSGHLDSHAQKWAAEQAVQRVKGVKAVALELDVRPDRDHVRSDTDIAMAAELALHWHSLVPSDAVRVTVNHGTLTVEGQVDWDYQRESVMLSLSHLKGVRSVINRMTILRRTPAHELQARIREALTRRAIREASHIDVEIVDGTVTLAGQVDSWHDRAVAQGAAWAVPGITNVVNNLRVDGGAG